VLSVVPIGLILLEPDLGTALLLLPVLLTMLFMAGARKRHLAIIIAMGLAAAPLAWTLIRGYQRARVTAVLLQSDELREAIVADPDKYAFLATKRQAIEWAASSGYQLVHSKNTVGSGGLIGYGWGEGPYVASSLLPDRHNDFIFSIIGHQWGILGCVVVLGAFAVIVLAGVRIAAATTEPAGRLLAVGVLAMIVSQVVINVGMSVGLMPITGMTLPFVSYGGSSLLTNFIAAALLISVSRNRPFLLATRPFEFAREQAAKAHLFEHEDVIDLPDRVVDTPSPTETARSR
jgi:rod shape determining protein RodA